MAEVYIARGEYDMAVDILETALEVLDGDSAGLIRAKLDKIKALKSQAEAMPTSATTVTPTPMEEGPARVELKLSVDCFTYTVYKDTYVCTGLSEKGYAEFVKYGSAQLVSIKLPGISDTGEVVMGFYSKSEEGYDLIFKWKICI